MNILNYCLFVTVFGFCFTYDDLFYDKNTLIDYSWRLSEASNEFGLNLLRDLAKRTPRNIIFSPISISSAFGLLYYGARGKTAQELEKVLGYKDLNLTRHTVSLAFRDLLTNNLITVEPRAYVLDLANTIFVNDHLALSQLYKFNAEEFFKAPIQTMNFEDGSLKTAARINDWVRNKTRGKICSIVDNLDLSVDLIAVNALYFKSRWMSSFSDANTRMGVFYNGGVIRKSVPMMEQEGTFMHYEDEDVSLVHLALWGRNMSMFILLPREVDGLLELEKSLTHDKLNYYLLNTFPKVIQLKLPKFNLTYTSDLVPSLRAMGAKEIFQPLVANMTGMVLEDGIAIGEVRHKVIIDVNESGVEASGVTATLSFKSMPLPDSFVSRFTVDHPFLFCVLDKRTDLIVLIGRVWNL